MHRIANNCVDMKVQHRINIPAGEWWSCKSATLQSGNVHCVLNPKKSYVLAEAYENDLHIRFANADSDQKLTEFIHAWGPLRIPFDGIPDDGLFLLSLEYCRAFRQKMRALIDAFDAFRWDKDERSVLVKLIEANDELEHYVASWDEEP